MTLMSRHLLAEEVAPLVGARIEILLADILKYGALPSLPSWERGLKLQDGTVDELKKRRSPRGSED